MNQDLIQLLSGIVLALLSFMLGRANKKLDQKDSKIAADTKLIKNLQDGLKELLRVQLIEYHDKYVAKGTVPSYVMDNFSEMYGTYHELGGNGTITLMYDEFKKIPINKED